MCHALSVMDMFVDIGDMNFKPAITPNKCSMTFCADGTWGKLTAEMGAKSNETILYILSNLAPFYLDNLQKDDNLGQALDYFSGVMDGKIDNSRNLECAYRMTKILSELKP